jgi:AraC family transcriptional regulator of adaptative response/methylated-DNA-[protein]-cysteine methyltransferase
LLNTRRQVELAMKQIRKKHNMIDVQLSAEVESSSDIKDAFFRIIEETPTKSGEDNVLKVSWLDTKLGPMVAIADEEALYLLEFVNWKGLELQVLRLRQKTNSTIIPGTTVIISMVEKEMGQYFEGKIKKFKTPIYFLGSPFQQCVWEELLKIPYGETRSYAELAKAIEKPTAFRAAANANGANMHAIIIPCHRVINSNGDAGGYGGGITRKAWLIQHEHQNK